MNVVKAKGVLRIVVCVEKPSLCLTQCVNGVSIISIAFGVCIGYYSLKIVQEEIALFQPVCLVVNLNNMNSSMQGMQGVQGA